MATPTDNATQQNASATNPQQGLSDKELNFRALQAKYEKQLAEERQARLDAEKLAQDRSKAIQEDDDTSDDPYVDHRKLEKKLAKFGEKTKQETQSEIRTAVQNALYEERKQNWLKNNPDFFDIMQHAQKFADKDPELAETILEMPDTFERQKLVYKNIKAFGLHKPEEKKSTVQEKINANQRSPYYRPSDVNAAPYASQGDFSPTGQKNAYAKLQELKKNMRI